jgi:hypothetical protein
MPYWIEHRLFHINELEGDFTSPVTNETMFLTDLHRGIAGAVLLCLPYDPEKRDPLKFGYRERFPISRKVIGLMYGKPVTEDTYANWVKAMTQAGVFVFTMDKPGGNYFIEAGLALDCARYGDRGLCDPETHYPYWFKPPRLSQVTPSVEQSTPSSEPSPELGLPEETPPIHLDIKKENKPEQVETSENTKELELETLEKLPENYQAWAWIRAGLKPIDQPSSMDIAEAWRCFKLEGVDLEPGGLWLDGRPNPLTGSKHN